MLSFEKDRFSHDTTKLNEESKKEKQEDYELVEEHTICSPKSTDTFSAGIPLEKMVTTTSVGVL